MIVKFHDNEGDVIATLESGSESLLLGVEKHLLGSYVKVGKREVQVTSFAVYDDLGFLVSEEYAPVEG